MDLSLLYLRLGYAVSGLASFFVASCSAGDERRRWPSGHALLGPVHVCVREAGGSDDDGYAGNDGAPRHNDASRHDGWSHGPAGHDAGSDAARTTATSGGASPGRAPQQAPSSQQQQQQSHTVPR